MERETAQAMKEGIRKALLAGTWYSASARELKDRIKTWTDEVSLDSTGEAGRPLAIVTPHAGVNYSGRVAAYAWQAAQGSSCEAVILIGPSHRVRFRGVALYEGSGYESPLGVLSIDKELFRCLAENCGSLCGAVGEEAPENSLELQVPFIQVLLPGVPFVPVLMGTQDQATCDALAAAIIESVGDRRVLIAASSDLSHFHDYKKAVEMDMNTLDYLERRDRGGFLSAVEAGDSEACGSGAVAVAMAVAESWGCDDVRVLSYANSGDVAGDRASVVGYAAIGFFRSNKAEGSAGSGSGSGSETPNGGTLLSSEEKDRLLAIARDSIRGALAGDTTPREGIPLPDSLNEYRGAFVTLKKRGRLRGCIGFVQPTRPLYEVVADVARAAAFDDPRFDSLTEEELKGVTIEISALTPLKKIDHIDEINVGKHGLYVVKGFQSGLLLPQVALEHGWGRVAFLKETCRKAGLADNAWKEEDTAVHIFSADVFGEGQ